MKIDNAQKASQVRMAYAFIPAFIVLAVFAIYWFGLTDSLLLAGVGIVALALYVLVAVLLHNNYVLIFIGPDKVIVRYKALWPINTENNSIEIKTEDFAGYDISKIRFRTILTVYKNTPGGRAKYPDVCINLLSDEQIEKVKRSFAILETVKRRN